MKSDKRIKTARVIFQVLIYLSVIFLLYYLSKIDYLAFHDFHFQFSRLALSLVVLWAGFLISPLAWAKLLTKHHIPTAYNRALVSEGLYIFTKYIPGKIMIVLGRAGYIGLRSKTSMKETGLISLKAQVLSIIAGLVMGMFALSGLTGSRWVYLFYFAFFFLLLLYFNNSFIHKFILRIIHRLTGKQMDLPLIKIKDSQSVFYYYLLMWLFWSSGFYLLLLSLGVDYGFQSLFILALANTLGVIAIISPGGIGIREGILVVFLNQAGVGIETATAISVLGRLWYMSGEVFFFLAALIVKALLKDEK